MSGLPTLKKAMSRFTRNSNWRGAKYVRSYIARYPVLGTAQSTLHFTPADLFIPTPSRLLWRYSVTLQLRREDYSFTYPHMYVARYSFIQLTELWQRGKNEIAKASKRQHFKTRGFEPGVINILAGNRRI